MYIGLYVKHALFLSAFIKLEISRQIIEKTQMSGFVKFRPMGTESFLAEGRTDMTKLIVDFLNVANATKN